MTQHPRLYDHLTTAAIPWLQRKYSHPALTSLFEGSLDPEVMRYWLEQDYQYLLNYSRCFCRVAAQAPKESMKTVIDGAHYTINIEIPRIHELGQLFSANYTDPLSGPTLSRYSDYLTLHSASYEGGIISLFPCMLGFSFLGISPTLPEDPRFRQWVEIYASTDFQNYTARYAHLVNQVTISYELAESILTQGLQHEIDLWDEAYSSVNLESDVQ